MIRSANADVWRLLADLARLQLLSFDDDSDTAVQSVQEDRQTVANQIQAFYNAQTVEDAGIAKRAEEMAAATVWETLKDDAW
jgi:hypothetical protein